MLCKPVEECPLYKTIDQNATRIRSAERLPVIARDIPQPGSTTVEEQRHEAVQVDARSVYGGVTSPRREYTIRSVQQRYVHARSEDHASRAEPRPAGIVGLQTVGRLENLSAIIRGSIDPFVPDQL